MRKIWLPLAAATFLTTTLTAFPAVASADTYEPNDTQAQAYPLSADTTYTSYLSSGTDVDYYQYTRSFTGTQYFSFIPPNDASTYNFQVIDANNAVLAGGGTSNGAPINLSFNVSQASTPYYIKVYSNGTVSPNAYQLVMGHHDTGEANNTQAQAYPMSDGHSYNAVLATNADVDYYVYNAPKNGVATISLTQPTDAQANFSIYDDLGTTFAGGTIGGGGGTASAIPFQFNVTGGRKYYVKYSPTSSAVSSSYYNISFDNLDTNEPNDSFAQATPINTGFYSYYLHNVQDVDFYKFHATTSGTMSLDIQPQAPSTIGWNIYQGTTTTLAGGSTGFPPSSSPYSFSVTAGYDYYFKVFKQSGDNSQMCYTLRLR